MNLQRLQYDPETSPWLWSLADSHDIDDIMDIARYNFQSEILGILTPDEPYYRYQVDLAITTQRHHQAMTLFTVARSRQSGKLIAYTWIARGTKTPYSQDELAEARILHLDLTESTRTRIALTVQALTHWETWCRVCAIPVIISSTIRKDQTAFMHLHEQLGYEVRGSISYKRLDQTNV